MGFLDSLRSSSESDISRDASVTDPSLDQLRVGDVLEDEEHTWTVVRHERFDHEDGPVDRWTLDGGTDTMLLEHGPGEQADIRSLRRATPADVAVDGHPFLEAVQNGEAPDVIEYQGTRHELREEDVRGPLQAAVGRRPDRDGGERALVRSIADKKIWGVFGGLAAFLGVPSPVLRAGFLLGIPALGVVWEGLFATFLLLVLGMVVGYAVLGYVLPEAASPTSSRAAADQSHYWLYEGENGIVALECRGDRGWSVYDGHAVGADAFDTILPGEHPQDGADLHGRDGADESPALHQLREGYLLDYDESTWEVIRRTTYNGDAGPVHRWTLEHGTDVRVLEHEYDAGNVFRLSAPADLKEVTIDGDPFLNAVSQRSAPRTIEYQGTEYVLAEEDARLSTLALSQRDDTPPVDFLTRSHDGMLAGVLAGIGEHTGIEAGTLRTTFVLAPIILTIVNPLVAANVFGISVKWVGAITAGTSPAFLLMYLLLFASIPQAPSAGGLPSRYWVYEKDGDVVALECEGKDDWSAYAGREVDPSQFENILPRG